MIYDNFWSNWSVGVDILYIDITQIQKRNNP